jgi:hypothetical protein
VSSVSTLTLVVLSVGVGFSETLIFFKVSAGFVTFVLPDFKSVCAKLIRVLINNNTSKKNICLTGLITCPD